MSGHEAAAEKRQHARYRVGETVFAVLESGAERHPAELVNVAKGGVCLRYYGEKGGYRWQLTISCFHADCFLGQLPVEIVHEEPMGGNGREAGLRRCGLKFSQPSYTQQALWELFIEQNAKSVNGGGRLRVAG